MNYNQIVAYIEDFATRHKQINTFYNGQTWDFEAKENVYPALITFPLNATIQSGQTQLTLTLIVGDLLNKDRTNVAEVQSDTLEIIQDLFALLDNSDEDFFIDNLDVISCEPFEEKFDDVVAGWVATVNLKYPFSGNNCILPLDQLS